MPVTVNHAIVFAHDKQHSASLFDLPEPVAWGSMRLLAGDATRCCLDHAVDGGLEHWADPQPITNHGGRGVYFRLRPGRWAGLVGSDGWPRMAGLTMARSRAVTKANATRCKRAGKPLKGLILGELSATMGWHRNHAGRHSRRR